MYDVDLYINKFGLLGEDIGHAVVVVAMDIYTDV